MTLVEKLHAKMGYYNFIRSDIIRIRGGAMINVVKSDIICMEVNLKYWRNRLS